MTRLFILSGTLAIAVLFDFVRPDTGEIGFPFSDKVIYADSYVYFFMEHVRTILLVLVIWELDREYRVATSTLLAIQFVDLIDFVLTYNTTWFKFISVNTLAPAIFGLSIVYEGWKKRER